MKRDLCIPVYLNDKTVFDLLAILENGFSQIREINSSYNNSNVNKENIKAEFKVSEILSSLLGVTLSGDKNKELQTTNTENIKQERIHTNVSLFSKLRKELIEKKVVINVVDEDIDISNVEEGDFIEIEGLIQKNPLVETLSTFVNMFKNLGNIIEGNQPSANQKTSIKKAKSPNQIIVEQMESMLNDLTQSNTIDLLLIKNNLKVLIPSQISCFQNEFESDILDGKFKVFGKVIKVISSESEAISMFRKSSLKILAENSLDDFMNLMSNSPDGVKIPKMISKIEAPAMIILPIAIYI